MSDEANPFAGFIDGEGTAVPDAPTKDADKTDAEGLHDASLGEKPELELTEEDQVQEGETEEQVAERHKRSKPLHQRLGETTEKWRTAEARAVVAEQRLAALETGKTPEAPKVELPARPDPSEFEFGIADPAYAEALTDWKVEAKLAERDAKAAQETAKKAQEAQTQEATQQAATLDANWQEKATKAVEKYPDFNETVLESAAAGEWDLLPLSAAAVQGSEVADDIAYHLATNRDDASKLANLERQFHATREAAMKQGVTPELANLFAKPYFDQAAALFESIEGKYKGGAKKTAPKQTSAPEPPKHSVRGGGGRYEVDGSTTDFAAFEAKANAR